MAGRCAYCNHDADLTQRQVHQGGSGYVWVTECRSKPACWDRQGVTAFSEQLEADLKASREQRRIA
jgi:hypothetical protein